MTFMKNRRNVASEKPHFGILAGMPKCSFSDATFRRFLRKIADAGFGI
jgi:hypothetical protein